LRREANREEKTRKRRERKTKCRKKREKRKTKREKVRSETQRGVDWKKKNGAKAKRANIREKGGFEWVVERGALKENRVKRGGRVLKRERDEEAGNMGRKGKRG
jgi:hypothetical protein